MWSPQNIIFGIFYIIIVCKTYTLWHAISHPSKEIRTLHELRYIIKEMDIIPTEKYIDVGN
jgi:hypothetical protein